MANFLYAGARSRFLWGDINMRTDTFSIMFLGMACTSGGGGTWAGVGTTGWAGAGTTGPTLADIPSYVRTRTTGNGNTVMDVDSFYWWSYEGTPRQTTQWNSYKGQASGLGYTVDGEIRASDMTFPAILQTAGQIGAFVLYKRFWAGTGATESQSPLVAYFDQATNLPIYPNGGDITIQWSTNPNYVFKL